MKTKLFLAFLFHTVFVTSYAQDNTVKQLKEAAKKVLPQDTAHKEGWKKGGLFTLNLAQGSLSNWQGGGDKSSFSAVGFLNLFADFKEGKHNWNNSKYGYQVSDKWYGTGLFNFRSQFTAGYAYEDVNGISTKSLTSKFMAPAYILLSLGFDYKPVAYFSVFISPLTERWVIVSDDFLSSLGAYGVVPGEKSRNELGAFLSAEIESGVMPNVTYKSRLDAFSNYKDKPGNIDLFWTNVLAMKVNKFLTANIAVDLLYDHNAVGRLQMRQLLGIGFSAKF